MNELCFAEIKKQQVEDAGNRQAEVKKTELDQLAGSLGENLTLQAAKQTETAKEKIDEHTGKCALAF